MSQQIRRLIIALAVFAGATLLYQKWREGRGGYGLFDLLGGRKDGAASQGGTSRPIRLQDRDVPALARFNEETTRLAAAVLPSVVSVDIGAKTRVPLRDIFGLQHGYGTGVVRTGLGSGVFVSREGHIVTNHHVVKGAEHIQVTTNDRKRHTATFLGADPDLDIAVLQIPGGSAYPPLDFADSDKTRVGEMAFAFGSPFGLEFTMSRGIVSATQRRLSDLGYDYVQTDTMINPGNSGGPLVNYHGEIIGINFSIFTEGRDEKAWQGIGLAVPANDVKNSYEAILGKRPPVVGYLGADVEMIAIPDPVRNTFGDLIPRYAIGAFVNGVIQDSPAQKAGLQAGDIVAQFNGVSFETHWDFMRLVTRSKPGQTVTLTVLRKDQPVTITARIEARPPGH